MRKEFRFGSITLPTTNHILEGSYIIDMYVCMYVHILCTGCSRIFVCSSQSTAIHPNAGKGWMENYKELPEKKSCL